MFQSIKFLRYLDHDDKTKLRSYEFEITDSEFGSVVAAGVGVGAGMSARAGAVIAEYKKRGLDVVSNLNRLFEFNQKYGWSIKEQIFWCKQYQPLFKEYQQTFEEALCAQCGSLHFPNSVENK
jgi:hypothetical protein